MSRRILLSFSAVVLAAILIYPQQDKSPNHPNKKFPAGERSMWDLQASFNLCTVTGAAGNAGAEFDGTYIYTTRWASNLIHKIDIEGNLIEEFSIPGVSGLRDLAFDGTYMYGGAAGNVIYQMDFNSKTLIGTITSPVAVRFIAYDEENDGFWCGSWADDPTLVSRSGTVLASFSTGLSSQYGAAYDNVSAGGPYLWMFDQGTGACPGSLMIIQYDIASGTAIGEAHDACQDLTDGIAGGLFTTTDYISGSFSIGGVMQSYSGLDDTFFLYEIQGPECLAWSSNPNPPNGATDVSINLAQLSWTNEGDDIVSNELYFGPAGNMTLVQSGTLPTSWNIFPLPLEYFTNYYWRVVEICENGETSSTYSFKTEQHVLPPFACFYPQNANYWTGTTDGTNKTDVSEVRGFNTEDGWFMFDISTIPLGSIIDEARFYGYVNYTYYPFWSATPLPGLNPLTAKAAELKNTITNYSGQSAAYIYSNESSTFTTGWHNYLMGNSANADIQNAISQGWFAMGMDSRDNSSSYYINWDGWAQTNIPYLEISYHWSPYIFFNTNFDNLTSGQQVSCQDPVHWTTWSLTPCDPTEDPYISTNYSFTQPNSVVNLYGNDLLESFPGLTTGKYLMQFWFYIPSNKSGYFEVMAEFSGQPKVKGMECYFDEGGGGRILIGDTVNFNWQENTWQIAKVVVDLDNDQAVFRMGNNYTPPVIAAWEWSRGGTIPLKLDAINFYGITNSNEMYMDNYVFEIYIPVELTAFRADVNNRDVVLSWQTATELNNRGFEIERKVCNKQYKVVSEDSWKKVGFIAGNGTTTKPQSYSYTDGNVAQGKYSYRLKQIDFDGSFKYSDEVIVDVKIPLKFSLEQNYPNPFNPSTKIKYSIPEDGYVSLKIYNTLGQQVTELINGFIKAGNHEVIFNSFMLSSGVYFYKMQSGNKVLVKKMMVLK